MARRRSRSSRGKGERELRVERFTWGALVLVIGITQLLPEAQVPPLLVPLLGAIVLFTSGLYQSAQGWRVSVFTWIAAVIMLMLTVYTVQVDPGQDFLGESLIVFAAVILIGVVTGET